MHAWFIARKDLLQIVRDRKSGIFLLLMPVLFTVFFGFAFRSFAPPADGDDRLTVGIMDTDQQATLNSTFGAFLRASEDLRFESVATAEEAATRVESGELAAALVVPPEYEANVLTGDPPALDVIARKDTEVGRAAVQALSVRVFRFAAAGRVADIAANRVAASGVTSERAPGESADVREKAFTSALQRWREPSIQVVVNAPEAAPSGTDPAAGYVQASPGMIVQFAMFGLILSAMVLVLERRSGALARLASSPVRHWQIVAGHVLAMFLVVLGQIAILIAFGQFVLGVDYLRQPLAVLAVCVVLALWAASLGLLIGSLARTEDQVIVGALVAMFMFSALGGAWFPLEVTGQTFSTIGHLTPGAWAMDAFHSILLRGQGLVAVLEPIGVLATFSAAFFALAVWRYDPTG